MGLIDGISYPLVIKSPKVFNRAAAPADNQKVCQVVNVGIADGRGDLLRCFRSLDPDRQQPHAAQGIASAKNTQNIVNCCPGRAGNNANSLRILGDGLFLRRIEKPLLRQLLFQRLKSGVQVSNAVHCHGGHIELVLAVSGVDRNPAKRNDLHTAGRAESQRHGVPLKHDTFQGRLLIFQSEIVVTGWIKLVIADFPSDCHLGKHRILIHPALNILIDLGNRINRWHITPPSSVWQAPPHPWHCPLKTSAGQKWGSRVL